MGMAEKSGFLACVLRLTVVTVCAAAIQQISGSRKNSVFQSKDEPGEDPRRQPRIAPFFSSF